MAQRIKSEKKRSPVARAASSLKKTVIKAKEKLTSRRASPATAAAPAKTAAAPRPKKPAVKTAEHPRRIVPDVPMDQLSAAYTPKQTSLKTSFRADGSDRQRDQELASVGDERWRDEDRLTNRSGDPRIGTHGRTYDGRKRT